MQEVKVKLYEFSELKEEVKKEVLNKYIPFVDFIYSDAEKTVDEFCLKFNISTSKNSWLEFDSYNDIEYVDLKGLRLRKYFLNNFYNTLYKGKYYGKLTKNNKHLKRFSSVFFETGCNLTGVCYDLDILQPIYDFITEPNETETIDSIFKKCFDNLSKLINNEIEYLNSNESKTEAIESFGALYTENGQEFNI